MLQKYLGVLIGEGLRTGELACFIRLSGCNLRCSYCDTKYALENNILAGQIYYTPLKETFDYVQDGYGLAFHGTKDPWADNETIENLCAQKHIELIEIPEVNHSLEMTDSVVDDIDFVADVIETVESYVSDYE